MAPLDWPWLEITENCIFLCENVDTFHIFVCLFQRLSLRRQILSTAGLPKPTIPLKTEESEKVLSEIPTSPFSATKKAPKENTYFSTYSSKKPEKSMPYFYPFLFPESRRRIIRTQFY